jgi:hypothetical protein
MKNTNLHDKAAVSFRAGRSLVTLRDLFHSCVLPAGLDRKSVLLQSELENRNEGQASRD